MYDRAKFDPAFQQFLVSTAKAQITMPPNLTTALANHSSLPTYINKSSLLKYTNKFESAKIDIGGVLAMSIDDLKVLLPDAPIGHILKLRSVLADLAPPLKPDSFILKLPVEQWDALAWFEKNLAVWDSWEDFLFIPRVIPPQDFKAAYTLIMSRLPPEIVRTYLDKHPHTGIVFSEKNHPWDKAPFSERVRFPPAHLHQ